MEPRARILDLIMSDNTQFTRYNARIPVKYVHSEQILKKSQYNWLGEMYIGKLESTDTVVTLDTYATRQRHKEDSKIVHIRTGIYTSNDKKDRHKKVMGIIRDGDLYVVTCKADKRFEDISEYGPVRVTSIQNACSVAQKYAKRFSSTESTQKSA